MAQDACVELIRHAVYDEVAGSVQASSYSEANREFCKAWDEDKRRNTTWTSGASYGAISGYGNLSNDEKNHFRGSMCDKDYTLEKHSLNRHLYLKILSPAALEVVDNCIRANNLGLHLKTQYPDDDTLVVSLAFTPPPGDRTGFRLINNKNSVPRELSCSGSLSDVKRGTKITTDSIDMRCSRTGKNVQIGPCKFVSGGAVVISTNSGPLIAPMPKKVVECEKPPLQVIDVSGEWMFRGLPTPYKATIATISNTDNLTLTNERHEVSQGRRESPFSVTAFDWRYLTGNIRNTSNTDQTGHVLVWSNGSWWSRAEFDKISSPPSDRSLIDTSWKFIGRPTSVEGTDQKLVFRNEKGQTSSGRLIDPFTVEATGWGIKGKLIENRSAILWSNGSVWLR
jgi:hypothetical protein